MNVKTEQEMVDLGRKFAKKIRLPVVVELVGDVGVGKTTFVRGLAEGLGVKEPVTSPSFMVSKTYALPEGGILAHYDFYRLTDPGLMADELSERLQDVRSVVVIEWGESVADILPEERVRMVIKYNKDGTRDIIKE